MEAGAHFGTGCHPFFIGALFEQSVVLKNRHLARHRDGAVHGIQAV